MKPTKISAKVPMSNHIEEYYADATQSKEVLTSKELFKANPDDVDIKTDINFQEIILINKILFNNDDLRKHKLKPVYTDFLNSYMRLKISLDRKSRGEFVDMNRSQNKPEDTLTTMSNLSNIMGAKK